MSIRRRLMLTYALFICVLVVLMSLVTNQLSGKLFAGFVRKNIAEQSQRIAEALSEQYVPENGTFDQSNLLALGMSYVHQGYILSVEDATGGVIWDARACDMEECAEVIREIEVRMQTGKHPAGKFAERTYPLTYGDDTVGYVRIETYNPFFFSESEAAFLRSLDRYLLLIGAVCALLSMGISAVLAGALARPILKAAQTAKRIAGGDLAGRIPEDQKTQELLQLTRSVNELAAALEQGQRWQKRLISDVAHELRTPLTTLQGNLEAMMDGVWEPTSQQLASCHEEVIRLNKLVADLGLLSLLEQETLVLQKTSFDLAVLLAGVAEQFAYMAAEKGIVLAFAGASCPVYADHDRLKQVFLNLISNAVHNTDQGRVDILLDTSRAGVTVRVADTGIGIAPKDLPHIFERFYRADGSRSRATGGAGIGLTVAASIVAAHGGTIEARSGDEKGSVFCVTLPGMGPV